MSVPGGQGGAISTPAQIPWEDDAGWLRLTPAAMFRPPQGRSLMLRAPQGSMLVRVALLFVAVAVACAQPAGLGLAQSMPPAAAAVKGLDELFNRLRAAKDEYEAGKIEQQIDELWSRSGKP